MTCYRCEEEGTTTREHVPPLAFFPEGFRTNLWTVPSCEEHNLGNSRDVEYVRNVIVSHRNVCGTAQELAQNASFRSFERSSALFYQTFENVQFVIINGERTATYPFDLPRFKRVMKAVAYAIFYKDNEQRKYDGNWNIFSSTLLGANDLNGVPDDWQGFRELIGRIPFALKASPEPWVFQYGTHQFDDGRHFAYAFEFYGGLRAYVWTSPR